LTGWCRIESVRKTINPILAMPSKIKKNVPPEVKPKLGLMDIVIRLILLIILVPIWIYAFSVGNILFYAGFDSGYYVIFPIFWWGIWILIPFLAIRSNFKARRRKTEKTSA